MYQQISQHTDLPLVCSQYRQGGPTESGEQWLLSAQCLFFLWKSQCVLIVSKRLLVRFYEGVLELCLTAADKKDPQRLGPHFYKNGEPEEDRVGQQAFQER